MATALFIAPGNPHNIVEGLDATVDREGDSAVTTILRDELRKHLANSVIRPGTSITPKVVAHAANARKKARELTETLNGF